MPPAPADRQPTSLAVTPARAKLLIALAAGIVIATTINLVAGLAK